MTTMNVKPLEWKKNGNDPDSVWTGELASLRVFYTIDPECRVFRLERGWQLSEYPRDDLGLFPTRAEAERYANDDWQAKLASALNIEGYIAMAEALSTFIDEHDNTYDGGPLSEGMSVFISKARSALNIGGTND